VFKRGVFLEIRPFLLPNSRTVNLLETIFFLPEMDLCTMDLECTDSCYNSPENQTVDIVSAFIRVDGF
jgi:hypothetical protein